MKKRKNYNSTAYLACDAGACSVTVGYFRRKGRDVCVTSSFLPFVAKRENLIIKDEFVGVEGRRSENKSSQIRSDVVE